MAASVGVADTHAAEKLSCSKDALKAFLKHYKAEDRWKAIGVIPPPVNGARKGSPLARQIAIANLVEQLYKSPIAPDAFHTYEKFWAEIVDRVTGKAWSLPSALRFDDPSAAKILSERVLQISKSVSREELDEILEVAPFEIPERKKVISQLPARETIVAQQSIDDIRITIVRLEERLAEALSQAASPTELVELRNQISKLDEATTVKATETLTALKEQGAQINELQSSLRQSCGASAELHDQMAMIIGELDMLKQQNADLAARVVVTEDLLSKEPAKALTPLTMRAPGNTFLVKPSVKIIEQPKDTLGTIAEFDQVEKIAVALRNAGLTKRSAETTASVLAASFIASGWVNISGSLSAHLAARLTSAACARRCLVNIPVGCLEQIAKPPIEWAGSPTLWRILGFDRAPVQVTARPLKSFTVRKLITGFGENFVIAVHEGGDICRNVLSDAVQLGAWIDTDSLSWSGHVRGGSAEPYNMAGFARNTSENDLEDGDHKVEAALARLLEARFLGALGLFISDEALKITLLERHVIAPVCAADARMDPAKVLTDEQALRVAMRLRVP